MWNVCALTTFLAIARVNCARRAVTSHGYDKKSSGVPEGFLSYMWLGLQDNHLLRPQFYLIAVIADVCQPIAMLALARERDIIAKRDVKEDAHRA